LLQPALSERIKTRKEAIMGGIMTPNEARAEEGWKPLDGGDTLYMQQQNAPLGQLATINRGNAIAPTN
jgi:phage portal protein BeeE